MIASGIIYVRRNYEFNEGKDAYRGTLKKMVGDCGEGVYIEAEIRFMKKETA